MLNHIKSYLLNYGYYFTPLLYKLIKSLFINLFIYSLLTKPIQNTLFNLIIADKISLNFKSILFLSLTKITYNSKMIIKINNPQISIFIFIILSVLIINVNSPCGSNCKKCSASGKCKSCYQTSQFIYNNDCYICSDLNAGCLTCVTTTCKSCQAPTFYLSSGTCVQCSTLISNCQACTFNPHTCVTCIQTYYLENNTCLTCASKFTNCNLCNVTDCTQCVPHYMVVNSTCTLCNTTISDCDLCN